jgi:hypothetical protein
MKRFFITLILIALSFVACLPSFAQESGTNGGLGVFIGAAFPQGATSTIPSTDWQPSLNWGYYVNIPLISTFHLTTSSELFKLGTQNATDFDLAFKFIIPLSGFKLFVGFAPGLTSVGDALDIHIGALGGASFNLVSNLDGFVQAKYTFIFDGSSNIRVLHANAGILFNF